MIVTFSNDDVVHFASSSPMRDAVRYCDEHRTRIRCTSTPNSILRDLQGSRERKIAEVGSKYPQSDPVIDSPERRALSTLGRLDLLDQPEPRPRWWPLRIARRRHERDAAG